MNGTVVATWLPGRCVRCNRLDTIYINDGLCHRTSCGDPMIMVVKE